MFVGLVLALGVTDSASSLPYPYTNELVNSFIKARIYTRVAGEDGESIWTRVRQAADYDVATAERGIVYIDEVDKIARKSGRIRASCSTTAVRG